MISSSMSWELERDGFCHLESFLDPLLLDRLRDESDAIARQTHLRSQGLRNPHLHSPTLAEWVQAGWRHFLEARLRERLALARSILFDKTLEANWSVPWHQDLSIAVRERIDQPGYTGWSVKESLPHVQPPVEVLCRMATLRLHLDDCDQENGALRVLPGSHRLGKLDPDGIQVCRRQIPETICRARAGDAWLMRPLLLHASSPVSRPGRRRVVHLEYGPAGGLAPGLQWPP